MIDSNANGGSFVACNPAAMAVIHESGEPMYKIHPGAVVPVLALFCLPALAQPSVDVTANSRYSYAQAAYVPQQHFDTDAGNGVNANEEADGFAGSLSYHFVNQAYIFARGDFTDLDSPRGADIDGDYNAFSAGLGLRGPLADTRPDESDYGKIDIYTEFSYEDLEVDGRLGIDNSTVKSNLDGNGYGATIGLRWLAAKSVELNPYVGYLNYGKPDLTLRSEGESVRISADEDMDGVRYGLRAVVDVTDHLSAIVGYERSDLEVGGLDHESNTLRMGVRWYFPSRGVAAR